MKIGLFMTCVFFVSPVATFAAAPPAPSPSSAPSPAVFDPAATPSPAPSSAPGSTLKSTIVLVPAGTPVTVSFLEPVSSDTATEGTEVAVQVTREVDINGIMIIPKGSQGQATLTTIQHSGGNGSGGKVQFNVDWVQSVDGGKIALSSVNHASDNADRKGAASTLGILGWATLGIFGLFSHNIAHGNAAVIGTDKAFNVFVDHDVHVTSNRASTSTPGFDS